jgi:molybdate/tungstate transport system substrate-binding protein
MRRLAAGAPLLLVLAAAALTLTGGACGADGGAGARHTLRLIYAGSVIIPFDHLAKAFQKDHPELEVLTESHGSIQCIRQVTELHRPFDYLVTADYSLVPPMMYGTTVPGTGRPYADWYVKFLTNRMVLAYTDKSRHADKLTARDWYTVITQPGVRLGLADPRFDAAGYRALMVLQLAEGYYRDPIIFENALLGKFTTPVTADRSTGVDVIHVPELLETQHDGGVIMRGSSVQLLPLLESGDVDYAFEYESVVRQRGLKYLRLPPAIDLGSPRYVSDYRTVVVKIDMRRFSSVKPEFRGGLIAYAFTIPQNAPNPAAASEFAAFVLGAEGRRLLTQDHQPLIVPPQADRPERLPAAVRAALRGAR